MSAATYTALAYVIGHAVFSSYLLLPFERAAGELTIFCGALVGASLGAAAQGMEAGEWELTTTMTSPMEEYLFLVPPRTLMQSTLRAPELSATFSIVSVCIIISPDS